jgi:hypothetical protein
VAHAEGLVDAVVIAGMLTHAHPARPQQQRPDLGPLGRCTCAVETELVGRGADDGLPDVPLVALSESLDGGAHRGAPGVYLGVSSR